MPEAMKRPLFLQGLRPDIRLQVEAGNPSTLQDTMTAAVRAEITLNTAKTGQRLFSGHAHHWRGSNNFSSQRAAQQTTTVATAVPMEMDMMDLQPDEHGHIYVGEPELNFVSNHGQVKRAPPPRPPNLPEEEYQRRVRARLCTNCAKGKHRTKNCNSPFNPNNPNNPNKSDGAQEKE